MHMVDVIMIMWPLVSSRVFVLFAWMMISCFGVVLVAAIFKINLVAISSQLFRIIGNRGKHITARIVFSDNFTLLKYIYTAYDYITYVKYL